MRKQLEQSAESGHDGPLVRGTRVLIVEHHDQIRADLQRLLYEAHAIDVVGAFASAEEAVSFCARSRPSVVLMGLHLPGMDAFLAIEAIKRESPDTRVLIVSNDDSTGSLVSALRAGASGYLLSTTKRTALIEAVRAVSADRVVLSQPQLRQLMPYLHPSQSNWMSSKASRLSAREEEVLTLLARGLSNRAIAERLVISASTVKVHVEHILAKLGVRHRTQAAVVAIELGIIVPGDSRFESWREPTR